jgi:hypothetical protein
VRARGFETRGGLVRLSRSSRPQLCVIECVLSGAYPSSPSAYLQLPRPVRVCDWSVASPRPPPPPLPPPPPPPPPRLHPPTPNPARWLCPETHASNPTFLRQLHAPGLMLYLPPLGIELPHTLSCTWRLRRERHAPWSCRCHRTALSQRSCGLCALHQPHPVLSAPGEAHTPRPISHRLLKLSW